MNVLALIVPVLLAIGSFHATGSDTAAASVQEPALASPNATPAVTPLADYKYGKKCNECDFNVKNGLKCTIPAKKTCGRGDLSRGSGYCVAQPTDSKGYCSSTCKKASDCPSGYSCTDLKTGAGGVCVK